MTLYSVNEGECNDRGTQLGCTRLLCSVNVGECLCEELGCHQHYDTVLSKLYYGVVGVGRWSRYMFRVLVMC